ncbi:MAG: pseudouridine synthase [Anaerolineae bacterium]
MYRYAIAYKPFDVLCAYRDRHGRETLETMGLPPALNPAGRLDLDSEGLLLLTDDGQALHRLTHPDFHHTKTYVVLVLGHPDLSTLDHLRQGVEIKLGKTRPADIEELRVPPPLPPFPKPLPAPEKTTWLRMVLQEGMNRQIKRMTAAVGHPTVRLVRVAIGRLSLPPDLAPGQWRDLNAIERRVLIEEIWPHGRQTDDSQAGG